MQKYAVTEYIGDFPCRHQPFWLSGYVLEIAKSLAVQVYEESGRYGQEDYYVTVQPCEGRNVDENVIFLACKGWPRGCPKGKIIKYLSKFCN